MSKRVAISKKSRFEILKRDKFSCRYCGAKAPEVLLHIEHIVPVAKGGTNDFENLIAACEGCNQGKGARLLTDQTAIEKSRDLLAKSQAEIEQLEEMIRWRKSIANKKAKQKEFVIAALEEIANCQFSEYGVKNVLNAYNKYDFDTCADYIAEYLQNCEERNEHELKQYSFSQYIAFRQKKDTIEGRQRYLIGIVRNRTNMDITVQFSEWLYDTDLTPGDLEDMIQELKQLRAGEKTLSAQVFLDWWHSYHRAIMDSETCCEMHSEVAS